MSSSQQLPLYTRPARKPASAADSFTQPTSPEPTRIDPAVWPRLQQSLRHDLALTVQLEQLLKRERTALETRAYQEFEHIVGEKLPLLRQLETGNADRRALLNASALSDEQTALAMADRMAPAVAGDWRSLAEHWTSCQHLNAVNDKIAQRTRMVVGQMLDLLRGQGSRQTVYTANGDTQQGSAGRTISSA